MDGVGHNPDPKNNAVAMAKKPNFDRLRQTFPSTLIRTDGGYVGLPDGQFGNSEVGHLNIGLAADAQSDPGAAATERNLPQIRWGGNRE